MTGGFGEPYTVVEYGIRRPDGQVESVGTEAALRAWKTLFTRGVVVSRRVTGRDRVFTDGPFAGCAVRVKPSAAAHPGCPGHIDEATEWAEVGR